MRATTFAFWVLLYLLCHTTLAFHFYSPEGFDLACKILLDVLPNFEPHHYQIDGICKVLSGIDLVASTPTGSGKTGFLFLLILVMIAIAKSPGLCRSVKFPLNPVIIVVCPTNSIEQQLVTNMAALGITALSINADTIAAARIAGDQDLWTRAQEGVSMLILGPEQLISPGFRALLSIDSFYDRICVLGVDEIHLLVQWGLTFRKAFLQIGLMRARLLPRTLVIGLTATLLSDTKILFRQLHSGLDGWYFPELAWVLKTRDKTIIFGSTISRAFRIKIYLNSLYSSNPDRDVRIRMHTGLNWPEDKLATLEDIVTDPRCQVIIGTNGLAQGNDIKVIKTVIQMGEPESMEMYVQKPGRARPTATNPRGIFYISAARMQVAETIVAQSDAENEAEVQDSLHTIWWPRGRLHLPPPQL
ncbi:P-loop containing nucleoside triphosphate hydrolase protein [Mycena sp. CBHHK59/15]|nr:P-loop containing nucleoside triphosphate hydrolase protein [Mycena sp. CBHHK59/15]